MSYWRSHLKRTTPRPRKGRTKAPSTAIVPSFVEVTVESLPPPEPQPVHIHLTPRGPSIRVEHDTDLVLVRRVLAALC
jgi:hypothetical protein